MMNERKIILPFVEKPYMTMYNYLAFSIGIIQANGKEKIVPWLCGKYINCSYDTKVYSKFTICTSDIWAIEDGLMSFQKIRLFEKTWNDFGWDPLDCVKDMIANGNYPCGEYNEEYIPASSYYGKCRRIHDYLIIGFDDVSANFLCVGYTNTGNFEQFSVPYDCMRKAFETTHSPKICFGFYSYNFDATIALDISRIVEELQKYVNSTDDLSSTNVDAGILYGIKSIEALVDDVIKAIKEKSCIDLRYLRGFMEHKFLMKIRMEYLHKEAKLLNEEPFVVAADLFELARRAYMLTIKYNMTHKISIAQNIAEIMQKIIEQERIYLPQVITWLKEYDN